MNRPAPAPDLSAAPVETAGGPTPSVAGAAAADTATNLPEVTVSELASALKRTIETAYDRVRVRGELGRVTIAKSGHLYADLKDDKAVISTVMWKGQAGRLKFKPEEGLEVVAEGRLSTYAGRSQYQLIAESMAPAGAGALMALLDARKKALAAEGLFAAERKQALPFLPEVVGVVTSPTGAVIRDILHRISDRCPRRVLVWPVVVQGDQAAAQVSAAIAGFNAMAPDGPIPRPDVIIVARGGGSVEDLWSFNEEVVVRAAAASEIPLISAVGHETDTTLIDYAADVRAPTPTAAAEIAVPVRAELLAQLSTMDGRVRAGLARRLERAQGDLRAAARGLPRLEDMLGARAQRLDAAGGALRAALKATADREALRFQRAAARLRPEILSRDIARRAERPQELAERALTATRRGGRDAVRALAALSARLASVHPKAVLSRGYALVHRPDGTLARRAADLKPGDRLALEFAEGQVDATVDGDAPEPPKRRRPGGKRLGKGGDQRELF